MALTKIKQVQDFKLLYNTEIHEYLIIKILNSKEEIIIAKIGLPFGAYIPCILTIEDHLQNYVLTFDDYKNFIQLVDESYYRFEINKKVY